MDRSDIQLLARHSKWPEGEVEKALAENVYPGANAWLRFLTQFCMFAGVGLLLAGVIFFFAYNWDELPEFVKFGLVLLPLCGLVLSAVFLKVNILLRRLLLTGAAVLTGVLFAVFGQVYQTGADSFDFFLAWTLFISIWVFAARFDALWLFYIALLNVTAHLYFDQAVPVAVLPYQFLFLFVLNSAFCYRFERGRGTLLPATPVKRWLTYSVALAAACWALISFIGGLFDGLQKETDFSFAGTCLLLIVTGVAAYRYALRERRLFYLLVIVFSGLVIITAVLIRIADASWVTLPAAVVVTAGLFVAVRWLLGIQKKWTSEK